MQKRVLTGIQPTGDIHIGNHFGAIKQLIEFQKDHELYVFVADLHSLTTTNKKVLKQIEENIKKVLSAYISLGLDPNRTVIYKQSDFPQITELMWIFTCLTTVSQLKLGHSYKDKSKGGDDVNSGILLYPVLMASDILIADADIVPIGEDQRQHLEITRDIVRKFNSTFGSFFNKSILKEPKESIQGDLILGTDGRKMSKSYENTISIFDDENVIKKQVMGIVTDSKSMGEKLDIKNCNVLNLYRLVATKEEIKEMEGKYQSGNIGYGEAKNILFEKTMDYFKEAREKNRKNMEDKDFVQKLLNRNKDRLKTEFNSKLNQIQNAIGFINQ